MKNIKVIIGRTNKAVTTQAYTYNEAGFTYNQAIQYGGIYGSDIYPMVSMSREIKPTNMKSGDIGTAFIPDIPRTLGRGMLIGMLGMTYNQDIIVN